jgi:hypothetical protein
MPGCQFAHDNSGATAAANLRKSPGSRLVRVRACCLRRTPKIIHNLSPVAIPECIVENRISSPSSSRNPTLDCFEKSSESLGASLHPTAEQNARVIGARERSSTLCLRRSQDPKQMQHYHGPVVSFPRGLLPADDMFLMQSI